MEQPIYTHEYNRSQIGKKHIKKENRNGKKGKKRTKEKKENKNRRNS